MMEHNRQKQKSETTVVVVIFILTMSFLACGQATPSVDIDATIAAGIAATQQAEVNIQATVEAAVLATEAASQSVSDQLKEVSTAEPTVTPIPVSSPSVSDAQQVRTVILNEVNGTMNQNLDFLKSLYAPNAVVIDHNGTPDDSSDDTTWRGWINIERRYLQFFSAGYSSIELVDLSIQVNGDQTTGIHQGVVLDGTLYEDMGIYTLEKSDGQWLITRLEYGNKKPDDSQPIRDDGLYILEIGSQHRYEEPWGWDRGDPCQAWRTGNFDDTKPNYRGFNVELLLTNNSETKVPDDWTVSFTTANGKSVQACRYDYEGAGPPPGATSSVTFFTVVEKGDFVQKITLNLEDQTIQLCLDGKGGWWRC